MEFFIDESGSINKDLKVCFVICIIAVKDSEKLKKVFKKYIRKKLKIFKEIFSYRRMFDENNSFKELKGSSLRYNDKRELIKFFCQNDLFEIYYIEVDNQKLLKKLYDNPNMTFNYSLRLFIENILIKRYKIKNYIFNIDTRNTKTKSLNHLEEYLETEIGIKYDLNFKVNYYKSETSKLIQLADVFSNIYYSHLINNKYVEEFEFLIKNNYLVNIYKFPINEIMNTN